MRLANRVATAAAALLLAGTGAAAGAGPASAQPGKAAATPQAVRHFANVRFQRCLDADTNTGGNGGKVQLWDCGPWNQQWWQ
jgi:endo-1,4-beta-xylanase